MRIQQIVRFMLQNGRRWLTLFVLAIFWNLICAMSKTKGNNNSVQQRAQHEERCHLDGDA